MPGDRLITLLTDFGLQDNYVGVMKGVIARINPDLNIIDITHDIPPQNLDAANFCLMTAYPYFPSGTIHVAVVDPGVGTQRKAVAIELLTGFLVGPDNGIFTGVLDHEKITMAVELTNPEYWLKPESSATFHGRDIFAPVGARLAAGTPLLKLGMEIDPVTLTRLDLPACTRSDDVITGYIQYIDRFGTLVTNITGTSVKDLQWSVTTGGQIIPGCKTYGNTRPGGLLALEGGHGFIEIAVNGGSANSLLEIGYRSPVHLVIKQKI
ncbi:MAG TPA: SAM-dependent chlorinase/fluorinase [Syntrophales bacterium]|nr:SAM-dependent chlorinase/fluorinase [Syntrophales bacterium]